MHELTKNYGQEQLIEMRKDLDLLSENFQERSKAFQEIFAKKYLVKVPSSSLKSAEAAQQSESVENVRTE